MAADEWRGGRTGAAAPGHPSRTDFLTSVVYRKAPETVLSAALVDTSLITAFLGAQMGEMQLAMAARLACMNDANNGSSIAQLVDAADQSANSLVNVAAGLGTNLDVTA